MPKIKREQKFHTGEEALGKRLDSWLASQPRLGISRSRLQRLIDDGDVRLDGEQVAVKTLLHAGQEITLTLPDVVAARLKSQNIPLDILFEDKDLLIINKPAGLVVHPGAGHLDGTLANALLHHFGPKIQAIFGAERPGIVHRLDKDTSGCLVVAKSEKAFSSLTKQIASHEAGRTYQAIVWGRFDEDRGLIDAPLGRSQTDRRKFAVRLERGKEARTHFVVKERFVHGCLLEIKLETGRTHQIRAHLLSIGRPIVNDPEYGTSPQSVPSQMRDALKKAINRQALHAWRLDVKHPISGKALSVKAPIPPDFLAAEKIFRKPPQLG
jgi:23S rRNA pseudouridine1911/1915/1917 synthase